MKTVQGKQIGLKETPEINVTNVWRIYACKLFKLTLSFQLINALTILLPDEVEEQETRPGTSAYWTDIIRGCDHQTQSSVRSQLSGTRWSWLRKWW